MLTYEEQELNRQDRLNEVGTEPPCPFCRRPRVNRPVGGYIRCNPCGVNWLNGEDISKDPRFERKAEMLRMQGIGPTKTGSSGGAPPAESNTE
jgi:ribosomal protein L37AE/L43A